MDGKYSIPEASHDNGKTPSRKRADGDVVLDGRKLRGRRQNAHVVQFVEEQLLVLSAGRIFRGHETDSVCQLTDGLNKFVSSCRRV